MNEKEAREIVSDKECLYTNTAHHDCALCKAKGYLEALDKARGLEEAAIEMRAELSHQTFEKLNRWDEALAKFRGTI